jgi:exonuclease III
MVGHRSQLAKTLQVIQVNVGRGSASHDIALTFAHNHLFDIVLIQEPWIHQDKLHRISKKHPAYHCFSPVEDWTNKPRVLTYVRKDPQLHTTQLQDNSEPSRDVLMVQLIAWGQQLLLINIYNAPPGSKDPGLGVQKILSQEFPQQAVLVAGDF